MNAQPQHPLFRKEAVQARRGRIDGEIVLTQPVGTRLLTLLLFAMIVLAAGWITLGKYTRSETARGILVTDQPSAEVVALRPGQVTALLVSEGQRVEPGQPLALVQVEQSNEAGGSAAQDSLAAIEAQRGFATQQARLAEERAASGRAKLEAALGGLAQRRSDLAAQSRIQQEVVASARDLFQRIESIVERGFVSHVEVERRRQAMLAAQQQLAQLQQQANALVAEEAAMRAELARVAADAGSERAGAFASAEALAQQRARIDGERAYTIKAPIAGRVAALQTATGRSVDGALPLMEIVPEASAVRAHIFAPTRAMGFVRPGQEVRLLYDAYPYQRFGSFKGRVLSVSTVALDPRQLAAPLKIEEPVYRVEVAPDDPQMRDAADGLQLQPGMTLSANIILERRSFLDWLLAPLNAVLRRNG